MAHTMGDRVDTVALSDEQFSKLVELLTPSYEMAKFFLAQHKELVPPDVATVGDQTATVPPPNEMTGG